VAKEGEVSHLLRSIVAALRLGDDDRAGSGRGAVVTPPVRSPFAASCDVPYFVEDFAGGDQTALVRLLESRPVAPEAFYRELVARVKACPLTNNQRALLADVLNECVIGSGVRDGV
jgi:hypothetical protein